ncbi:Nucleotide-binding universal stress protein, UspA family [Halopseudomonas litoralis]|uniref:Nucleotide-binding universal stress protein, UspA family n=1 Tax=Halopseudomonas litoralis TaxID=797277 RepID=A0A1H1SFK8_9GAMM|nr:universal stress protein [Halopseudomonas litoralis]SDS46643.1 Nucleotide-binding universal stress protein, UspA family [Halopseudomonas litoralis]
MQNVLVPFDGSDSAKRAVNYLVEASKAYPDILVHVLNVQREANLYGNYVPATMLEDLRQGALKHAEAVNAEAVLMLQAAAIRHEAHQAVGEVVSTIVAAVKKYNCDTVVMGTRGMGSLGNLVMGSVATRVVHDVTVPVLLVK